MYPNQKQQKYIDGLVESHRQLLSEIFESIDDHWLVPIMEINNHEECQLIVHGFKFTNVILMDYIKNECSLNSAYRKEFVKHYKMLGKYFLLPSVSIFIEDGGGFI